MDDEIQYRCAGYIQAEIERYAEFLDDDADEDDNQKSDADDLSEDENEGTKEVKARKKAPRREGQIYCSLLTFGNHRLITFILQLT
jgi:cohesin complex subunit SA-1/2